MYTLYIGNKNYSSWSLRPWVLLKVLQIDFAEELVPFDDGGSWEKFRRFSPTGMVPCLHHSKPESDQSGEQVVWESLAIAEYLAEQHPEVWPTDAAARAWARSAAAEMHGGFSALRNDCPMTVGQRIKLHAVSDALRANLARIEELWAEGLARFGGPFLAGDQFTAVDAFFAPVAFRMQTYGTSEGFGGPATDRYVETLLALPAMQSWQSDALIEVHREPGHDVEIAGLGEIFADHRQD